MSKRTDEALRLFNDAGGEDTLTPACEALLLRIFAAGEAQSAEAWDSRSGGRMMREMISDLGALCRVSSARLEARLGVQALSSLYGTARVLSAQRLGIDEPSSPACPDLPPPPPDNPDPDAAHVKG